MAVFDLLVVLTFYSVIVHINGKPPHIVFIVADDLGWNDVGFHNPTMITPNINKLAREGVLLNQSYVQPVCSPSRHSFMTGYYPWKAGLQHLVIGAGESVCSPLNMTFFPEKLQAAGYATHAIGKWHLGFCSWNCTPQFRGFDSFYGYFNGREDYYRHTQGFCSWNCTPQFRGFDSFYGYYNSREDYYRHTQGKFLDFHDNFQVVWYENGSYSADLYAARAEKIINQHDVSKPLFLYLPYQSVHEPLQVPPEYSSLYPNIQTEGRRTFCGMVTALDAAIGRVIEALQKNGLYEDTVFFFTPDNGGWIPYHGNNYPLRGGKITVWEGGTRAAAFVSGAGIQRRDTSFEGLMHAVDWHPTILSAAGLPASEDIDGISQWEAIAGDGSPKRTEFVYNLDDVRPATQGHAAIRVGDYKLIAGYPGHDSGWYPPDKDYGKFGEPEEYFASIDWEKDVLLFKQRVKSGKESYYKLFNLKDDPYEYHNLADKHPEVVTNLLYKISQYHKHLVPAKIPPPDPKSNPKYYGNVWTPGWCEAPVA